MVSIRGSGLWRHGLSFSASSAHSNTDERVLDVQFSDDVQKVEVFVWKSHKRLVIQRILLMRKYELSSHFSGLNPEPSSERVQVEYLFNKFVNLFEFRLDSSGTRTL